MWIGVIIGLVIGALSQKIEGIIAYPIIFGFIGFLVTRFVNKDAFPAAETDLKTELAVLKEDLRRAHQRIDQLDQRLLELAPYTAPEKAQSKPTAPKPIIVGLPSAEDTLGEDVVEPAPVEKEEPQGTETPSPALPSKPIPLFTRDASQPERASQPIVYSVPQASPASAASGSIAPASAASTSEPPRREALEDRPSVRGFEPEIPQLPEWLTGFIQRWVIGGNPIVKIGVLILFLGLAFLLRYVAEHSTVPVEFRYASVAAIGIGLLLFGWRVRGKQDNYGVILQGAGIGVLYLTTLAGMKIHPLIPPQLAFGLLIGVAAFAVLLAVLQDSLALAVAAALGGFAAPVLVSTGSENHLAFFSYLALLNISIAAVAWFKAWRILNLIGFISTVTLANGWGQKYYTPELFNLVEPFLLLFFALYVLIAFLFARRTLADTPETEAASFADHVRQTAPKVSYVDGSLVFGVPMATFSMQYMIVRSFENGPAFSALGWGLAYIFLAFALFRGTGKRYALLSETMVALAVIFGSLAIPLGLEGKWTSAAWAVEAAGVYWLGLRQQRIHARAFALLLMIGAAIYFVLDLRFSLNTKTLISGSWLGCLMLAASVWAIYWLLSRAHPENVHARERQLQPVLVAFGCLLVALMPFMLLDLDWASTSLAVLGAVAVFAARPLGEPAIAGWGKVYQLLAGALFALTLSLANEGVALAGGWTMLTATGLLAIAMLASTWATLREWKTTEDITPRDALLGILVLMGGLLFLAIAPLYLIEWTRAAMLWAAASIPVMWWALRAERPEAALCALAMQGAAGFVAANFNRLDFKALDGKPYEYAAFFHNEFLLHAIIAITAFIAARLLHRRGEQIAAMVGWGVLAWSIGWWITAWETEFKRLLIRENAEMALLAVTIATTALWWGLARFAKWRQVGQAALLYLPALVLLPIEMHDTWMHPFGGWGALVWPTALTMHIVLLRGQTEWLTEQWQKAVHVGGAWFFMAVATFELQWQFMHWGGEGSAWSMLALALVPLGYIAAVASTAVRGKWPLLDFRDSYTVIAAGPVAVYLFGWLGMSAQMGNGSAPLPYVPVLNPIEMGQIATLLAIAMWWRSQHEQPLFQQFGRYLGAVLGLAAFGVVTSMVLRTCHQWGGVPWTEHALTSSMLVQTSLSIVWGATAIGLMLLGHFRGVRLIWLMGAGLVAVVVGKLFLVELAAHGSLERIVSFIGVGLLLLLVGYFAPLPPKQEAPVEGQSTSGDRA